MRRVIKLFRKAKYLSFIVSLYCSLVLFVSWSTGNKQIWPNATIVATGPPSPSPAPAPSLSRNKGRFTTAFGVAGIVAMYMIIGIFLLNAWPRIRNVIRQKQRSTDKWTALRWKYIPAGILWLFELIGGAGAPILSAVLSGKISPDEIVLVSFGILAVLFFSISISSNRDFGLVDAFVAIILGVLLQYDIMIVHLAPWVGMDHVKDEKTLVIIYIALLPALKKALLPVFKFFDDWASDDDMRSITDFMSYWIVTPDVHHVRDYVPPAIGGVDPLTTDAQHLADVVSPADIPSPDVVQPLGAAPADIPSPDVVQPLGAAPADIPSPDVVQPRGAAPADIPSPNVVQPRGDAPADIPSPDVVQPLGAAPADIPSPDVVQPRGAAPADVLRPVSVDSEVIVLHPPSRFARGLVSSSLPVWQTRLFLRLLLPDDVQPPGVAPVAVQRPGYAISFALDHSVSRSNVPLSVRFMFPHLYYSPLPIVIRLRPSVHPGVHLALFSFGDV